MQISDGAVQGSGVTITVRGQAGAEGAGGGTTAYGASGIVYYTPLQAETDFTSFVVIASKTGCIPVAQTIVTSASATPGYAGVDWGFVANKTTTNALTATTIAVTQKVDVETIKTNPVANGGTVTFPTNATLASTTNITAGTITAVGTLTTYTGNTPQTGDAFARLGAPAGASVSADVAAVKVDTAAILVDTGTTLDGKIDSILADTGTDGVVVAAASKTGYALSATGSAALTEGYAALGAAATLPQLLYEVRALLAEKSISTTTLTTKKLDGTTTAATYTLDDATTPSAITRAS